MRGDSAVSATPGCLTEREATTSDDVMAPRLEASVNAAKVSDSWKTIPTQSERHLPVLDGVRGLAILLVMAHHSFVLQPQSQFEAMLSEVAALGMFGVDLFFVLSGFLITGILLDTKGTPNQLGNFYVRRVLRIFPLYYL